MIETVEGVEVGAFAPAAAPPLNGKSSKAELRAFLAEHGVDAPAKATKAELAQVADAIIATPYPTKTKRAVSIIGFAESSRDQVPWDHDDMEFWGINRLHTVLPDAHFDRYYQIHDFVRFHGEDKEHQSWLKQWGGPVYLRPEDMADADLPNAEPFPVAALLRDFRPYFTNTISWMLALAIAMGFEEIHIYGVDMAQDGLINAEYRMQRPSCEYFIGIAEGLGISVYMPPSSDLLTASHLYGITNGDQWTMKLMARQQELGTRKQEAKNQLDQLEAKQDELVAAINQFDGAMQDVEYWVKNWAPNPAEVDQPEEVPDGS